jgi:DNA-binding CsgD family transcriptional regulator
MFISANSVSYSLISFGQVGISVIAWVACVAFAKKFSVRSGIIGGFVWSVLTLGQALGNGLGMLGNAQPFAEFSFGVFVPLLIESLVLLVLVFTLNKPFLSLVHIEEQNIEKESDYADKISSIKSRYHLTPREAEVFEMLAYGRNARYIESKLCISSNTVKTHMRNIYIKTGARNHQELLSIIENED